MFSWVSRHGVISSLGYVMSESKFGLCNCATALLYYCTEWFKQLFFKVPIVVCVQQCFHQIYGHSWLTRLFVFILSTKRLLCSFSKKGVCNLQRAKRCHVTTKLRHGIQSITCFHSLVGSFPTLTVSAWPVPIKVQLENIHLCMLEIGEGSP